MRLPKIPNFVIQTPIKVFNKAGLSGEGQPIIALKFEGKCRKEVYVAKSYENSGDTNNYSNVIYLNEKHGVVDGRVEVDGETFVIGKVNQHLNPDGTYHHTKLYLM